LKPFTDLVQAGVCGFKCFLIHSGVDEFKSVTREEAAKALEELKVRNVKNHSYSFKLNHLKLSGDWKCSSVSC